MLKCDYCGSTLYDATIKCPNCGATVINNKQIKVYDLKEEKDNVVVIKKSHDLNGCELSAIVMMIIRAFLSFILIIPLFWRIPILIHYYKKCLNGEKKSTGFKICILLFISLTAGILMLCDDEL